MREFLRITGAAAAVLILYFAYMLMVRPELPNGPGLHERGRLPQTTDVRKEELGDAKELMKLLEDYRDSRGLYPVLPSFDVPAIELKKALSSSGVLFHSPIAVSEADHTNRYVSVNGGSYGLLLHFDRPGGPVTCLIEVHMRRSGWWGQPPACPL